MNAKRGVNKEPKGLEAQFCKCEAAPITIDSRLLAWENWMRERKRVQNLLGKRLGRVPGDLLMNYIDEMSRINEEKNILGYTSILAPPDPQRGSPAFWFTPVKIRGCLQAQPTPWERCKVPEVSHVRIPKEIVEEKGIFTKNRDSYKLWRDVEYRKQKVKEQRKRLKWIVPHRPDSQGLIVLGRSIQRSNSTSVPWSKPTSSATQKSSSIETPPEEPNATTFLINDQPINSNSLFLIEFDYKVNSPKTAAQYVKLENRSESALKIAWVRSDTHRLFKDIIPMKYEHNFFFNKNPAVILPKQTLHFPFWFRTKQMGTYVENWKLEVVPRVWPESVNVVVKLKAVAYVRDLRKKCEMISNRLGNGVRDRLIKEALDGVLKHASTERSEMPLFVFDKSQIFESVNSRTDPYYDRPLYSYDKAIVKRLNEIYEKVKDEGTEDTWNYSLDDLRVLIMKYEVHYKKSIEEIRSGSTVLDDKSLVEEFEELVRRLKTPSAWVNYDKDKYDKVYSILSNYVNKICEEIAECEETLGVNKSSVYPSTVKNSLEGLSKRLIYCQPDGTTLDRFVSEETRRKDQKHQTPIPDRLKGIPSQNYLEKYNAYHNLSITSEQPKPDDKKNKKDSKNGPKGKPGRQHSKSKSLQRMQSFESYTIDPNFDPFYAEPSGTPSKVSSKTTFASIPNDIYNISYIVMQQYHYNLYVIFYSNLCNAVSAMEDTLEMIREERAGSATIRRLEECRKWKVQPAKSRALGIREILEESGYSPKEPPKVVSYFEPSESLQKILEVYEKSGKPVSYPEKAIKSVRGKKKVTVDASVGSSEGGKLDESWVDFKEVTQQTSADGSWDLVADVEDVVSETSCGQLQLVYAVGCQKDAADHVSIDEEFYMSEDDN